MKITGLFLMLYLVGTSCFGTQLFESSYLKGKKGDFVIYTGRDEGRDVIFGFLYESEESYVLRELDLSSNEESAVRFTVQSSAGGLTLQPSSVIAGNPDEKAQTRLMLKLTELLFVKASSLDLTRFPEVVQANINVTPENPSGTIDYEFGFWMPAFFPIRFGSRDQKLVMNAFDFGRATAPSYDRFMSVKTLPVIQDGPTYKIETKPTKSLKFGRATAYLDENWNLDNIKNNIATLRKATQQDAQVYFKDWGVFSVDQATSGRPTATEAPYVLALSRLFSFGIPIFPESIKCTVKDHSVLLDFVSYNPKDKMLTHMFDVITWSDDHHMFELFLASYGSLYNDNREYFDSIVRDYFDAGSS